MSTLLEVIGPGGHQRAALVQEVVPAIRRLGLVRQLMRQSVLAHFSRKRIRCALWTSDIDFGQVAPRIATYQECPGSSADVPHCFSYFLHTKEKWPTHHQCKPFISNVFLVGSASFELATPAV